MDSVEELGQVSPSMLTYLLFELNSCVDGWGSDALSIEQVKKHVASGDVFQFLSARFDGHVDLSLMDAQQIEILVRNLQDLELALGGQDRRKFGVEKSGLCLLLAWTVELLQRHPSFRKR